ncbi:unnamed protein product, partial [Meganyctiphanes norvegica]
MEHNNEGNIKQNESYSQNVLRNSPTDILEVKVKEEIEVNEEPIEVQAGKGESIECDNDLSYNSNSKKHLYVHIREKQYQCIQSDILSKHSNQSNHLRTHTGEKSYKCIQCDKTFTLRSDLIKHQIKHHITYIGEKPYQCSQCDKAFSDNITLIEHKITHSVEKQYQCS